MSPDDGSSSGEATPDGGVETSTAAGTEESVTTSPDNASFEGTTEEVREQFRQIKATRRRRALGWLTLVGVLGFILVQGLVATEFFDDRTDFRWSNFQESLVRYFPVTDYAGVPFLDLGSYWEFIRNNNLAYDHEIGGLIFQRVEVAGFSLPWIEMPPDIYTFLFQELGMFTVFGQAGTTLSMGLVGTILGFPLALVFSVMASERVTPFPFNFLFRGVMSFIRAVPAIIWALIFVALVGLGAAAATLAIAFNTIGNLGRLFVEELEELEEGPIEAMRTTGANKPQMVHFGMLSQVRTAFIAWTLYIFEINVRAAVTVGVIGAGGLGQVVALQQRQFNYTNMMATLVVIFVLIFIVEMFSQRLRARLRSDEEKEGWLSLALGLPGRFADSLAK